MISVFDSCEQNIYSDDEEYNGLKMKIMYR